MSLSKIALVLLLVLSSACGAGDAVQCNTDQDCAHVDNGTTGRAICSQGMCIDSGLGPKGCFVGTPVTTFDYLNACTRAVTTVFDNCERLGFCGQDTRLPDPVSPPAIATSVVAPVQAAPPSVACADAGPNVIYMTGDPDFVPLLRKVTPLVATSTPPYRAVFVPSSACAAVDAAFDLASSVIKDVPATATKPASYAFYFDDADRQVFCTLGPEGKTVDVGVSNLLSTTCKPDDVAGSTVAHYLGPVASYAFVVPVTSRETAISVEAAHIVFGLGGQVPAGLSATPWTDPAYYFILAGHASTVLAAELIHVPRMAFWGDYQPSLDYVRDRILVTAAPDRSIAILPIDYADNSRGNLRTLFLQSEGQLAGVLPDSNLVSMDKANVRDGHYPFWGYLHFYTANVQGAPSPAASAFVTRFAVPQLDRDLLDAIIDSSLIPVCAMKVARDSDIGPLQRPPSDSPCGCYFENRTMARSSCSPCMTPEQCPATAPSCNYGFCEVPL